MKSQEEEEEGVSAEVESESQEIVEGKKKPKTIIVKKSQDKESNLNFK